MDVPVPQVFPSPSLDDLHLSDLETDVWLLIEGIKDPEFPYSLSELRVLTPDELKIDERSQYILIRFRPTVHHCSLATLIGLSILYKLREHYGYQWRIETELVSGSHEDELAINKQLADKERVAAALENAAIKETIDQMLT
jgi:metal-sulfur cluster biosynthetic enzyme